MLNQNEQSQRKKKQLCFYKSIKQQIFNFFKSMIFSTK